MGNTGRTLNDSERDILARFPEENPNPIMLADLKGRVTFANQPAEELLEKMGCDTDNPLPDCWKDAVGKAIDTGSQQEQVVDIGDQVYSFTFSPFLKAKRLFVYGLNITDRRLSEMKLQQALDSLNTAQEIAHIGNWDWDIKNNYLQWSDEIYRIFGASPQEFEATYEAFLTYVHPDDIQKVQGIVDKALKGEAEYTVEHRIVRHTGEELIVREQGEVFRDGKGTPVRMIGTVQDITRESESKDQLALARSVFENAMEGVMIADPDGNIEEVNPAFTAITGYTLDEVKGQNPRILRSDRHDEWFYKSLWRELAEKGTWSGEIWNRRKTGEIFPEQLSITAVKDNYGRIRNYVAVFYDLTDAKKGEEARFMANHDALTNLPNRNLFMDRLSQAIAASKRRQSLLAVYLVALDEFKKTNERLGYIVGDRLLLEATDRLAKVHGDRRTIARFGGDEFAIFAEDVENADFAAKRAEELLSVFTRPFIIGKEKLAVSASLGVALYPNDGYDAPTVMRNCDLAMHRAKEEGRNTYRLFTEEINRVVLERLDLERSLRLALDRDEFIPYYQPKVDLATGRVVGMEALARWDHPEKGIVAPGLFISVAEETGLIDRIGEKIFNQACRRTKRWVDQGFTDLKVAVNLSAHQFDRARIIAPIKRILDESGLPPENLEIEITESMVMENVQEAIETLQALSEMGISIAIDDFGTGYSSLAYLKRFPLDVLKIDLVFIRDMPKSQEDAEIVAAIISLAHQLKLKVVAEGVETTEHVKLLRGMGCDQLQGYHIGKPMPPVNFEAFLKGWDGNSL